MTILHKQTFIKFSIIIFSLTSLCLSASEPTASEPKTKIPNPFPLTIKNPYGIKHFVKTHQVVSTTAIIFNCIGVFLFTAGKCNRPDTYLPIGELLEGVGQLFGVAGTVPFVARYAHHCYKIKKLKSCIKPLQHIE